MLGLMYIVQKFVIPPQDEVQRIVVVNSGKRERFLDLEGSPKSFKNLLNMSEVMHHV